MSTLSTIKMTAQQFLQLGEDPPGVRLELVDGEIAVSPSPVPGHGFADYALASILNNHIHQHDLGQLFPDIDTIVSPFDVRRPDMIFFASNRLHLIGEKAMEGPPDLCVEIISPSSETEDRKVKFEQYRKFGVMNYWILDPRPGKRTLEGYRLRGRSYVLSGRGRDQDVLRLPPFPDLDIPLGRLWRPRGGK